MVQPPRSPARRQLCNALSTKSDNKPLRGCHLFHQNEAPAGLQAGPQEPNEKLFDLDEVQARRSAPVPVGLNAAHAIRQPFRVMLPVCVYQGCLTEGCGKPQGHQIHLLGCVLARDAKLGKRGLHVSQRHHEQVDSLRNDRVDG